MVLQQEQVIQPEKSAREPPIRPIIPPRKDAKIEQHGNRKTEPLPRNATIWAIRQRGRRGWKQAPAGFHATKPCTTKT